jgi:hypothetical protein
LEIPKKISVEIDLIKDVYQPLKKMVQGDTNIIEFVVKENGADADLSNVGKIEVKYRRPSKKVIDRILKAEGNRITYELGYHEMLEAGEGKLELRFYSLDNLSKITTRKFNLYLSGTLGNDVILEKDKDYTALQTLFIEVDQIRQDTDLVGQYAQLQGDYAKEQGNVAKEESSNLSILKTALETKIIESDSAINNANTAAENADTKATFAEEQGNHAKSQGDRAKAEADRLAGTNVSVLDNKITAIDTRLTSGLAEKATQSALNTTNANVATKADKSYVDTQIGNIGNASPKGTYATLTALQTAFPTGTTGIYIVTADGKWYYWNGSAWTVGGIYQSTGMANKSVDTTHLTDNVVSQLGYPITNIVPNGDFASGSTGWVNPNSTLSVTGGIASMLATAQNAMIIPGLLNRTATHKYYIYAKFKTSSNLVGVAMSGVIMSGMNHSGGNTYERKSTIYTGSTTTASWQISILDSRTSGWNTIEVDYLGIINLTETYGAGNEPTLAEMDEIFNHFPNGNFNGSLISAYSLKDVMGEIKKVSSKVDNVVAGNKLSGKTVLNFGDSIARGNEIGDISYATIIANTYGMTYIRKASGGAAFSTLREFNTIVDQVDQAVASAYKPNIIFLEGGTNDIAFAYELGTMSALNNYNPTLDKTTFSGAMEYCIKKLKESFVGVPIIFIRVNNLSSRAWDKQISFGNRAIEICEKWSVPVVDLYKNSNLNYNIASYKLQYSVDTESNGLGDGTHPTVEAYNKFYVPLITAKLNEIL